MFAHPLVLPAVSFDDQTRLYTGKVDNIGRYRVLSPEPPAELVMAKLCAEHPLWFRRVSTQTASAPNDPGATSHVPPPPPSAGNPAVPSPPPQVRRAPTL